MSQRVTWVLDADIRSFFDSVDHEWLLRMLAHRIADPRVLRLVRMWLEAGILESDEWHETDRGTPQGAGISPLLANIFLHYVLDLLVHQWRRQHARGLVRSGSGRGRGARGRHPQLLRLVRPRVAAADAVGQYRRSSGSPARPDVA